MKRKEAASPILIHNQQVKIVASYKYQEVHSDMKLKSPDNVFTLKSLNVSRKLQSVVASALLYVVVCWITELLLVVLLWFDSQFIKRKCVSDGYR